MFWLYGSTPIDQEPYTLVSAEQIHIAEDLQKDPSGVSLGVRTSFSMCFAKA
jgi:hypothetical protein